MGRSTRPTARTPSKDAASAINLSLARADNHLAGSDPRPAQRPGARASRPTTSNHRQRSARVDAHLARKNESFRHRPGPQQGFIKPSPIDPTHPTDLILLAYAETDGFGRLDDVTASSQQAHAIGKPHAFVHRVAARAFEQKRQLDRAIQELQLFLEEAPWGPQADAARHELEVVRALSH